MSLSRFKNAYLRLELFCFFFHENVDAREAPTPDVQATEQRRDSMSKAQNDEPCAFAKLWGQLDGLPFHCYMTNLPSTLGRGSNATAGSRKPPGFIDLGQSKALSREHGEMEGGRLCCCQLRVVIRDRWRCWCVDVVVSPFLDGFKPSNRLPLLSDID